MDGLVKNDPLPSSAVSCCKLGNLWHHPLGDSRVSIFQLYHLFCPHEHSQMDQQPSYAILPLNDCSHRTGGTPQLFWGLIFQRGLTTESLLRVRNSEAILLQYSVLTLRVKSPQKNKLSPNHRIWFMKAYEIQFRQKFFFVLVAQYDHNSGQSGPSCLSVWVKTVQPSAFPWSVPCECLWDFGYLQKVFEEVY